MRRGFSPFIGDGERFDGAIEFVLEENPLGTAGAPGLISGLRFDFLLINGDRLTNLDFRVFMEFLHAQGVIATITTHQRQNTVDYGMLEIEDDQRLVRDLEKPVRSYGVSIGVNAFRADVLKYVQPNRYLDIPQLMQLLMDRGEQGQCHRSDSFRLDIGRPADYARASEVFQKRREEFLSKPVCGS